MSRRLALITGASAGIGAAFAQVYAGHGYDLALTARREDRLEEVADQVRLRHGVEVLVVPADLADPGAPATILGQIADHGREVDALINNAGFGIQGDYGASTWAEQDRFLRVLLLTVCEMTHRVLPGMRERRFGRIVNVASLAGLVPGAPSTGLYGATKAFLVRFSQSLHLEVRADGVHVSALCPGFTHSEFAAVNKTQAMTDKVPTWMWLGADEVAAAGYEAGEANRPICVPGAPNKALAALGKLLPDDWSMAILAQSSGRSK